MMGKTHFISGAAAGAAVGFLMGEPLVGACIGAVGGLIPDIDEPGSMIGHKIPFLSLPVNRVIGHRTLTHTVEFNLVIAILLGVVVSSCFYKMGTVAALGLFSGALSHIVLDCCTKSGLRPIALYQNLYIKGPFSTGNVMIEGPVIILLAILTVRIVGM